MKLRLLVFLSLTLPSLHAQRPLAYPKPRVEAEQPDVAAVDPDPAFPLRVHLFDVRWGGLGFRNHGYGAANLVDGAQVKGYNFAFECEVPFSPNAAPAEMYQARWKKAPLQLEILSMDVSGGHTHVCTLHLAAEARAFDDGNRAHYEHGVSSSLRVPWSDPDFAYEVADPDYPLQFHVIDGHRSEEPVNDHGWGIANLAEPGTATKLQGADYTYDCGHGFLTSSQVDNFYQARWTKPGKQIELLLQRAGEDKVDTCKVTVALKPAPYAEPRLHRMAASGPQP